MPTDNKTYTPAPMDTEGIELPRGLDPLVESLAKNSHEVWAKRRQSEGWTYGPERNDSLKQSPDMVEYEALTEDEKKYDRESSTETLKIISKLGFSIVEKHKGSILLVGSYSQRVLANVKNCAEQYTLEVEYSDNWENAKAMLKENFVHWHAIILDAKGKLSKGDEKDTPMFLRDAIDDLNVIFSRKLNEIPWFIMPMKYDKDAKTVIDYTVSRDRAKKDWGPCVWTQDRMPVLIKTIADLLPRTRNYRLRSVYDPVFQTIEKYFDNDARRLLFHVLEPIHNPEAFFSFNPQESYDNVRRVLEAFFKVCRNFGIIPPDVCDNKNWKVNLRYCEKHIRDNKNVFPEAIAVLVRGILNHTNHGCHFGSQKKILGYYYTVMGLALQMCDVLMWLDKYVKEQGLYNNKK